MRHPVYKNISELWQGVSLQKDCLNFSAIQTFYACLNFSAMKTFYAPASVDGGAYISCAACLSSTPFLSLFVCLSSENFNSGHNFQMFSDRPFLFHMCISCSKTFLWYQGQGYLLRSRWNININIFHKKKCFSVSTRFQKAYYSGLLSQDYVVKK